ncbi:MAG: hypothetical protein ACXVAY_07095 [Mucilaginibacter sp.]
MAVTILLVTLPNLLNKGRSADLIGLPLAFGFLIACIPLYLGANRLVKAYRSLEIVLSENGVESKAVGLPYKIITWANLIIEEKSNGTVNLYDKGVSAFTRKMYGKGWIIIQPEMADKEALVNELLKHRQNY